MSDFPTGTTRILVTGSREWVDVPFVQRVMMRAYEIAPTATLVHGACRGVDAIAAGFWADLGGTVEAWPANWSELGRAAGPRRNEDMVSAGADVCLAFVQNSSNGARHCLALAEWAEIPVFKFERTTKR